MIIIDISWPISAAMTAYKDKKVVAFEHTKIFEKDNARESLLRLSAHTGTHVDAPAHFLSDGQTMDRLSISDTIGLCTVFDVTDVVDALDEQRLQQCVIAPGSIVLFKTRNSALSATAPFNPNFVYLSQSGAQYLAHQNVKAVGIDYLGIERNQPDHATHAILMHESIVIIEGLRLAHVEPGNYFLLCLPLAVQGLEAAPARALLIKE